ncbi:uncharacterized protein LOC121718035 isoform X2 [Alosa sapidissima]|uniref:uncharacterized protein LOC121718035 isoform X2 n=1 Tax=Alosa sapidissima TaxID=34773 RepID=UPI001C084EB4|nr:uncharacterized protein LOC121718035 isoform X2 [Alosa sapidissima]
MEFHQEEDDDDDDDAVGGNKTDLSQFVAIKNEDGRQGFSKRQRLFNSTGPQKNKPVSPVPNCVSMKSDRSIDQPPKFSSGSPQSHPKPHKHRPVSPVPSCVSMKSDQSMDQPPKFSSGPPQSNPKPQTHRPVSPVPSCVSMKSDRSIDQPPKFSSGSPQSHPKPHKHRPVSPVPSCVSMKSDQSMDQPPKLNSGPPQSNLKPQTHRPVYPEHPEPSCVSMKSDCSKVEPLKFSSGPPQSNPKPQTHRPVSPVPSCVSMKSDRSMDQPPKFSSGPPQSHPKPHKHRPVSPVPSCVSMKSDQSMDQPPKLNSGPLPSHPKPRKHRPVSPVPSCVSMKSDQSMDQPPKLNSGPPPSNPKPQTHRPVSPVPSCVSMKSDQSMDQPPKLSSGPPQSNLKPQTHRPVYPEPSCVSMKSDCSKVEPLKFSSGPPQSNPKPQTHRPVSPVPSCVSMKSDRSMDQPPKFSSGPPQSHPKPHKHRPVSPVPNCVSMKSDQSMDQPPKLNSGPPPSNPKPQTHRPVSPVPSCVSMKSDWSMDQPPKFCSRPPVSNLKPQKHRPVSPVPSCVSMKSDQSMDQAPKFSSGSPQSYPKNTMTQDQSRCGVCKQLLRDPVITSCGHSFCRQCISSYWSQSGPSGDHSCPQCRKRSKTQPLQIPHIAMEQSLLYPPSTTAQPTDLTQPFSHREMSQHQQYSSTTIAQVPPYPQTDMGQHPLYPHTYMPQISPEPTLEDHAVGSKQPLTEHVPIKRARLTDTHVLNRVLMTHKASMKRRFEGICEDLMRAGTQTLLNKIYTELYITEGESEGVNKEHEVWQVESASRPKTTEGVAINCNDIFHPLSGQERHIRTVMTKGIAGIGKTISVQKFILDWAEERANQDVDFMFVLPFRELNLVKHDQYSLHRLLLDFHPELREVQDGEYKDCHTVFIFDGLDESRLPLNFQGNQKLSDVIQTSSVDVLMTSLIQGTLLPSALIWVTSRPAAASQIPSQCISQVTEVRGFNDPQKEEYFRKRISDQNQANRIISHIKSTRSLHIMCHMPVFCWISAVVLQEMLEKDDGKEAPKTLTEMFIHFLLIQTTRKDQKYQKKIETDRQSLLEAHKGVLLKLAELAFKHLENGNLMFYEEDLRECGIDVSEASVYSGMCTEIFREECVFHHKKVYCFVHLSIQEFLAAVYIFHSYITGNLEVLKSFLSKKHRDQKASLPLHIMLNRAVDKALDSRNGHLDLFLRFLVGMSVENNQALLEGLLTNTHSSTESIKKTCKYIKLLSREDLSPERCINLFHCLFEMNDHSVHGKIQKYLKSQKSFTGGLSPLHCSALAYMLLMSEEVLDELDLMKYKTSEEGWRRLVPVVRHCRKAVFAHCDLTEKSYEVVASALQSSNSPLRELDLSYNDLQKSGEKLLSALQSPNCRLEKLSLVRCELTGSLLALTLQGANPHLRELDISDCELQDCGGDLLHQPLNQDCKVRLISCRLKQSSCEVVVSVLQSYLSQLSELDMSGCDLQTSEEKLLFGLRYPNCQLEKLRLVDCGLTQKSGDILAFALQSAKSHLRELDLSRNTLGDCAGKLCSEALNPHCQLETLRLPGCKLTEGPCEVVASAVQHMVSLLELDLSDNHMNDTGIHLLNTGIRQSKCDMRILRLVDCGLTEKSGGILAFALQSVNSELRELDLSKNILGDCGGKLGSEALNRQCMLETLRLAGCKLTEDSCEVVASAVQHLDSLTELDLSDNHLNFTGIQLLSSGISRPKCGLRILGLARCNLSEESCEFVASTVKSWISLTELDLSESQMSSTGIQLLNSVTSAPNCKLQTLRYSHGESKSMKPQMKQYACELTLDPNTAYKELTISEGNRKVTCVSERQPYPDHPERFDYCSQVLCREGLSGRCYWEAEWSGDGVWIGLAYKSIYRKGWGDDSRFGGNDKSWCLNCYGDDSYSAQHNEKETEISDPSSGASRVGVYLDWPAGTLSFYSVSSHTLTHLHTFHSTFTEPLYPGFGFLDYNVAASLCQIT